MYSSGALLRSSQLAYQSTAALGDLPAAGRSDGRGESAKAALTWDAQRPSTPERLKPYQHYARQQPGSITRHFGAARDRDAAQASGERVFGCKTKASAESAADCMATYPDSALGRWKLEQSERVYASTRQAPLGAVPSRGYVMPEGMGTTSPCGRPLHVREQEAKNSTQAIIFPAADAAAADEGGSAHKLNSHSSFGPGEQRCHGVDWQRAKLDPLTHRFGRVDTHGQQCSMKQVLQPDLDGAAAQPAVSSAVYERHKATLGDALGRHRILGAAPVQRLGPHHVFGRPSAPEKEPCVGDLLRGAYSSQQLQADPGLGKSLTRWTAAQAGSPSTPDRAFGLPSVRNDVPLPAQPSVANTHNYGNEPSAAQLLTPPSCVDLGVQEAHLLQRRTRGEMQGLLADAGIGIMGDDFEAVFALAAAAGDGGSSASSGGSGQGPAECSLQDFMAARQLHLRQQVGLPC